MISKVMWKLKIRVKIIAKLAINDSKLMNKVLVKVQCWGNQTLKPSNQLLK